MPKKMFIDDAEMTALKRWVNVRISKIEEVRLKNLAARESNRTGSKISLSWIARKAIVEFLARDQGAAA